MVADVKGIGVSQRICDWLSKIGTWKYALIVLAIGIILITVPVKDHEETTSMTHQTAETTEDITVELENILAQIQGAGNTKVLLTKDTSSVNLYQTDSEMTNSGNETRHKVNTVLISTGSGTEEALVTSVTYPTYRGAIVVCEGADSASVRLSIITAISSLTGLSSEKIAVIKMNSK